MTAFSAAESGYRQHMRSTQSERRTEYEVVARITHRLREAARNKKKDFPGFVAALEENRKLWQAFAVDVLDKKTPLPAELKARIFYLSEFTDTQTRKILRKKASVLPLLEVNMAVLRGLKTESTIQ